MDAASTTLELQPGRDGGVLMQRMVRRRPRLMLKEDWRLICEVMELVIGRAERLT